MGKKFRLRINFLCIFWPIIPFKNLGSAVAFSVSAEKSMHYLHVRNGQDGEAYKEDEKSVAVIVITID